MSSILDNVQPAVKKETKRVVKITALEAEQLQF